MSSKEESLFYTCDHLCSEFTETRWISALILSIKDRFLAGHDSSHQGLMDQDRLVEHKEELAADVEGAQPPEEI